MKIGIFANLNRDIEGRATKALFEFLKARGDFEVYLSDELKNIGIDAEFCDRATLAKKSDIMVVFGGDGTILRVAKECAAFATKIFAVNLGHMGFLAEVENDELKARFEQLYSGNYYTDDRTLIEVKFKDKTYIALNEVVLARGSRTKLVKFAVTVNGNLLNRYSADGVIVSTPTGSTAYSLSAGGPIVTPEVKAMVINPICAHTLNSRAYVVPENSVVELKLFNAENEAHLNVDGVDEVNLYNGDVVKISKSELKVQFIRLKKYNYFEKMLDKMNYWSTFREE